MLKRLEAVFKLAELTFEIFYGDFLVKNCAKLVDWYFVA